MLGIEPRALHMLSKHFPTELYPNPQISKWKGKKKVELEPAVGPCLCESASDLVRKLQGTEAKVSDQTLPV
jgi:hypothetical protein